MNLEAAILREWRLWNEQDHAEKWLNARSVILLILGWDARADRQILHTEFSKWAYFRQKYKYRGTDAQLLFKLRRELPSKGNPLPLEAATLKIAEYVLSRLVVDLTRESGVLVPQKPLINIATESIDEKVTITDARWAMTSKIADDTFECENPETGQIYHLIIGEEHTVFDGPMANYLGTLIPFPLFIHVFDVTLSERNATAALVVLQPDYLVDVTSIASCYGSSDFNLWTYFSQKILPRTTTYYMMLGNIVNGMLDEMIHNPEVSIQVLISGIFQKQNAYLSTMDDDEVRKLIGAIQKHYVNLRQAIKEDFVTQGIRLEDCDLEPSFISSKYGIQGRLDVLAMGNSISIIELKSGKPFRPNSYGLKRDHYIQTLLYDLLLKSARLSFNSRNFILYSSQSERPLRYAPPVKALQWDALRNRNEIVLADHWLQSEEPDQVQKLFQFFFKLDQSDTSSFLRKDIDRIKTVIQKCSGEEWKYYLEFMSFVHTEMALSKLGHSHHHSSRGLARLWLHDVEQKEDDFSILKDLRYINKLENGGLLLEFEYSQSTNHLANFRVGDIVVMYPSFGKKADALRNKIIKGSIVSKRAKSVVVRPRSVRMNTDWLKQHTKWNLEQDVLDSSFKTMMDSLFLFLASPKAEKDKWLGKMQNPDAALNPWSDYTYSERLTTTQRTVVRKAYQAPDFFLIWGPPGTGKTSVVLRELVRRYLREEETTIYLVSYTNRAVDEINSSILDVIDDPGNMLTRLGSRHGCHEDYQSLLYRNQIARIKNRQGLKAFLAKKRVVISTLASFWNMRHLVSDRRKSILIVDEASQILEPSIIGLLSYFKKVIFIGDHMQLPAVSAQKEEASKIKSASLLKLGITHRKMSLFERMFRQLRVDGELSSRHVGILKEQGRMHTDIMNIANGLFYQNQLEVLPSLERLTMNNKEVMLGQRLLFYPSIAEGNKSMLKNNKDEAEKVVEVVHKYLSENNIEFDQLSGNEIGVITPFRAQIALIQNEILDSFKTEDSKITIDTVERYQGSARKVIIISACINRAMQLSAISAFNEEGLDRKFNVALTRAKEQVILIGNEELLRYSSAYSTFIDKAKSWTNE